MARLRIAACCSKLQQKGQALLLQLTPNSTSGVVQRSAQAREGAHMLGARAAAAAHDARPLFDPAARELGVALGGQGVFRQGVQLPAHALVDVSRVGVSAPRQALSFERRQEVENGTRGNAVDEQRLRAEPSRAASANTGRISEGVMRSASGPAVRENQVGKPVAKASCRAIRASPACGKVSTRSKSTPASARHRAMRRCSGRGSCGLKSGR